MEQKNLYILNNFFFFLAYIPILILTFLNTSMLGQEISSSYFNVALVAAILMVAYKIFFLDNLAIQDYLFYFLISIATAIAYHYSGNSTLIILVIFLLGSKNVNKKWLATTYLIISSLLLLFVYYLTTIGRIPDLTYIRGTTIRHSFGIIYPTDFASHIFYCCCAYIFLRGRKYNVFDLSLLLGISWFVYSTTDARLNSLIILMLAFGRILVRYKWVCKILRNIWSVPILGFLFSFVATFFYNPSNGVLNLLNNFFSGRLSIVKGILNEYGLTFFGQKIVEHGWGGKWH
ncbi:hypothetical protein ACLJJ6_06400 [Pediococcus siamensis]|uniref:hypothetical protein n=1 Tax=Pediococcus siamensis TaxID=381829 RepID=UPI0039A1CFCC